MLLLRMFSTRHQHEYNLHNPSTFLSSIKFVFRLCKYQQYILSELHQHKYNLHKQNIFHRFQQFLCQHRKYLWCKLCFQHLHESNQRKFHNNLSLIRFDYLQHMLLLYMFSIRHQHEYSRYNLDIFQLSIIFGSRLCMYLQYSFFE